MNLEPIPQIIQRLRSTYQGYKFDMKPNPAHNNYIIGAIRDGITISTMTVTPETPTDEFWESVRVWMKTVFVIVSR